MSAYESIQGICGGLRQIVSTHDVRGVIIEKAGSTKAKRNGLTKPDTSLSHPKANSGMEKQQGRRKKKP